MSAICTDIDVPFFLVVEHVTQAKLDAAGLSHWLTDEEQVRYDDLIANSVAKRSRQWLLGRYAAKVACRRWLEAQGMDVVEWHAIQISNDHTGMPYLTIYGHHTQPSLSIAHSGEDAIAAIAEPGIQIGVDIENRTPHTELQALTKRITREAEYQRWFADIKEAELPERFRQLWLAKEATAKCTGRGLQWRPGDFEVMQLNKRDAEVCHGDEQYRVHYVSTRRAFVALAWRPAGKG